MWTFQIFLYLIPVLRATQMDQFRIQEATACINHFLSASPMGFLEFNITLSFSCLFSMWHIAQLQTYWWLTSWPSPYFGSLQKKSKPKQPEGNNFQATKHSWKIRKVGKDYCRKIWVLIFEVQGVNKFNHLSLSWKLQG